MGAEYVDDGVNRDLPWASVFDPAANLRAFSAVQAEGLRAASKLVDRFVQAAAAGLNATPGPVGAAPNGQDERADLWGATDIAPLITSWWAMVNQLVGGAGTPSGYETAALDISNSSAGGRLDLAAGAGATATSEVWLHNRSGADLADLHLRCSPLSCEDGRAVSADDIRFEPGVVPMPRRSSRGVEVTVHVHADVAPGQYHGKVWADVRPELWIPLVLTVHPSVP